MVRSKTTAPAPHWNNKVFSFPNDTCPSTDYRGISSEIAQNTAFPPPALLHTLHGTLQPEDMEGSCCELCQAANTHGPGPVPKRVLFAAGFNVGTQTIRSIDHATTSLPY